MTALRAVSGQSVASLPAGRIGPLAAFVGSYRADCPQGGSREMINLPTNLPMIGQVDLSSTVQVFTDCRFTDQGTTFTANGRVPMRGTYWKAERPDQDVRLQGPITLAPIAGEQQVDGRIGIDGAFNGSIMGVNVITGATAQPPTPVSVAQLLAGRWQGRTVTVFSAGCSPITAEIALELTPTGATTLNATLSGRVIQAGGMPMCAQLVGGTSTNNQIVTASNGTVNFSSGLTGEYNAAGSWMGGRVTGTGFTQDWQVVR